MDRNQANKDLKILTEKFNKELRKIEGMNKKSFAQFSEDFCEIFIEGTRSSSISITFPNSPTESEYKINHFSGNLNPSDPDDESTMSFKNQMAIYNNWDELIAKIGEMRIKIHKMENEVLVNILDNMS